MSAIELKTMLIQIYCSENNMNITFLLCGITSFPAGGFKVIFEYANRFAAEGHTVNIVMGAATISLKTTLAAVFRFPYYKLTNNYSPKNWFKLNDNINCFYHFTLFEHNLPKSDVVIATAVETAFYLKRYKGSFKKFYFIQDFENWAISEKKVIETYKFPFHKIVIADWLKKIVEQSNEKADVIPNGFDFTYFHKDISIEKRDKFFVLMMYHTMERKRCCDAIKALEIVKEKFPKLKIIMFGRPDKPRNIPFEFDYYKSPSKELHNRIYNESAIYIAASSVEGWGLTVGEAMICGCAVACTDNEGFKIMAHNNETALLSPIYNYKKLAENIIRLIEDDELRVRLATVANNNIQQYTWDNSYKKFKKIIFN